MILSFVRFYYDSSDRRGHLGGGNSFISTKPPLTIGLDVYPMLEHLGSAINKVSLVVNSKSLPFTIPIHYKVFVTRSKGEVTQFMLIACIDVVRFILKEV